MKSEMTKNERSALVASYDVNGVHVDIDIDFVKSYLVRGNAENITDQELVFFLNTCKSQKDADRKRVERHRKRFEEEALANGQERPAGGDKKEFAPHVHLTQQQFDSLAEEYHICPGRYPRRPQQLHHHEPRGRSRSAGPR